MKRVMTCCWLLLLAAPTLAAQHRQWDCKMSNGRAIYLVLETPLVTIPDAGSEKRQAYKGCIWQGKECTVVYGYRDGLDWRFELGPLMAVILEPTGEAGYYDWRKLIPSDLATFKPDATVPPSWNMHCGTVRMLP